jgi:hypothetical protein
MLLAEQRPIAAVAPQLPEYRLADGQSGSEQSLIEQGGKLGALNASFEAKPR